MTPKEALYWCEQFEDNIVLADPQKQKMVLALQAMKACKEALEKQIPKKVRRYDVNPSEKFCPNCGLSIENKGGYCAECGQALDWSDVK